MFSSLDKPVRPWRPWSARWSQLARAAGIAPDERLLLALSGGADSVLLLHLLAEAEPRPRVRVVHVDHGLRGDESRADARFCENLCRALGVPFARRRAELDPDGPSLEARAREERYRILAREARRTSHTTVLTGHHSDDSLETLLWRWIRGTSLPGLRGPRPAMSLGEGPVRVVRPLLTLRREEVRRLLSDRGLRWREDGSNLDTRFTRNRLRLEFLPLLRRYCGSEGIENLRAFGRAVESLEESLAGATAHLTWRPAPYARASRGPTALGLGGTLPRAELMRVVPPLRRRALWRLLLEGTGHAPGRALIEAVQGDLASGRCTRHAVGGGWVLLLRSDGLHLLPPPSTAPATELDEAQPYLPFPTPRGSDPIPLAPRSGLALSVPGIVTLPDGRRISAERVAPPPGAPTPLSPIEVELDGARLGDRLTVRWPDRGDRFRPLGAPGSKPLRRFLADRGVPREERGSVPVVFAADEIVWVAGVELGESGRIAPTTRERIRLTLHHDAATPGLDVPGGGVAGGRMRQRLDPDSPDTPRIPDAVRSR